MKTNETTIYQNAKQVLISEAMEAKRLNKNDKPMIRQIINDQADQMHRQIDFYLMKGKFSQAMANQYKNWLNRLVCKLHP